MKEDKKRDLERSSIRELAHSLCSYSEIADITFLPDSFHLQIKKLDLSEFDSKEQKAIKIYLNHFQQFFQGPFIYDTFQKHDGVGGRAEFRKNLAESGSSELFELCKHNLLSTNVISGVLNDCRSILLLLAKHRPAHFQSIYDVFSEPVTALTMSHRLIWNGQDIYPHPVPKSEFPFINSQRRSGVARMLAKYNMEIPVNLDDTSAQRDRDTLRELFTIPDNNWKGGLDILDEHDTVCKDAACLCFLRIGNLMQQLDKEVLGHSACKAISDIHHMGTLPNCRNMSCDCSDKLKAVFISVELAPLVSKIANLVIDDLSE